MCDVCKDKNQPQFKANIHFLNFQPVVLNLCYSHDIELFKRGQSRFIEFYKEQLAPILSQKVGSEGDFDGLDFT